MAVRNSAKAFIIKGNKILLTKCNDPDDGVYYTVPGGGQNEFESLKQAVKRECIEETGHTIEVDRMVAVFEEIALSEEFKRRYPNHAHKVFFTFLCHLKDEKISEIIKKDTDQTDHEWVDLNEVHKLAFYPKILKDNFDDVLDAEKVLFLGEMYN